MPYRFPDPHFFRGARESGRRRVALGVVTRAQRRFRWAYRDATGHGYDSIQERRRDLRRQAMRERVRRHSEVELREGRRLPLQASMRNELERRLVAHHDNYDLYMGPNASL